MVNRFSENTKVHNISIKAFQSDFTDIVSNYIMKILSKLETKRWIQKEISASISLV